MGTMNIGNATASNYTNVTDFNVTVPAKEMDSASGQKESEWQNSSWSKQWGYFNAVPDLKSAIILKATWNVGKGYTTDPETEVILDHISGWGKDSFQDILHSMEVMKRIGGDSYAEIIRDKDTNLLLNLKPLDPGSMKIICDSKGMITRYEQVSKTDKGIIKFAPEDILHFCNNRLGDQIHGISDIDALEQTLLAENESFTDMKKLMHCQARPMILWKLKTDDTAKINAFVTKIQNARKLGEDMFIPDDDSIVSHEIVQLNPSNFVLAWRDDIRNKFYRTIGLPQIVPGAGGQSTESESKVIYLAFEQIVEKDQKEIELQIWNQLQLKINLNPPTSMMENLQQDQAKDVGQMGFQPAEVGL